MRTSITLPALIAIALVAPATAGATERFVDPGATDNSFCVAPNQTSGPCKTVSQAVAVADPGDTIHIAPGVYPEAIDTSKRLNFAGAGAGTADSFSPSQHTLIAGATKPALELRDGGDVSGIRFESQDKTALFLSSTRGNTRESTVTGVVALSGDATFGTLSTAESSDSELTVHLRDTTVLATHGIGLVAQTDLDAERLIVRAPEAEAVVAVGVRITLTDARIEGSTVLNGGESLLRRVRVTAPQIAVDATHGGLRIEDSLLVADGPGTAPGTIALRSVPFARAGVVTVERSTLVARGTGTTRLAVAAEGFDAPSRITLTDTVAVAPGAPADARATRDGVVTGVRSAFRATLAEGGAASGGLTADPQLGPDLVPLAGSPLVDAGDPAAAGLDLAGAPRALDGDGDGAARADIGAFEAPAVPLRPVPAPQPPTGSGSGSGGTAQPGAGDTVAPALKAKRLRRGRLRIRVSEAAKVTVVARRGAKRKRFTRTLPAGARTLRLRGLHGRFRVTVTAVDAAGNAARPVRLRLRVR